MLGPSSSPCSRTRTPTFGSELRDSLLGYDQQGDPSPAWVEGFIEGAKEAWADVRDKCDNPPGLGSQWDRP